jgi:iron complex outermembrane receptor protein
MRCSLLKLSLLMIALLSSIKVFSDQGLLTEEDVFAEIDSVTGVTHLKQSLSQVPAAVTIIDRRTIEASTALNLVDLFRLVPGFQVYFFHGNKPSITYHIPGGEYSRRLEVKIDGRSVYEPLLSSVEWNTLGIDIDDIEYIEVVRGSNTATDGSNAFIASFNIVTRSPLADLGTEVSLQHGNQGINSRSISLSSQFSQFATRTTLKASKNDGFDGEEIDDSADTFTMKFQGLWTPTVMDSINFQLGVGDSKTTIGPSDYHERHWKSKYQHFNWKRVANERSDIELVLYHNEIDFVDNDDLWTVQTVVNQFDLNQDGVFENEGYDYPVEIKKLLLQYPENKNEIIGKSTYAHFSDRWDAELRSNIYRWDNLRVNLTIGSRYDSFKTELFLGGPGRVSQVSNRFNTNFEWTASDKLTFNYGNTIEKIRNKNHSHSDRAAANYQFSKKHLFRIASSQSYRDPTLLEMNQNSIYTYNNQGEEIILYTRVLSDDDITKEKQVSNEIGYLGLFDDKNLSLDIRLFKERFSNLIDERMQSFIGPFQDTVNIIDNVSNLELQGFEWHLQYKPTNELLVSLNHSYTEVKGQTLHYTDYVDENSYLCVLEGNNEYCDLKNSVPKNMFNLLASYEFPSGLMLSGSYHFKAGYSPETRMPVTPSYSRFDLKASKRWINSSNWMELSLTAQNLTGDYEEHFLFNKFGSVYVLGLRLGSN